MCVWGGGGVGGVSKLIQQQHVVAQEVLSHHGLIVQSDHKDTKCSRGGDCSGLSGGSLGHV